MLLMKTVPVCLYSDISSVIHADLLARLTLFSLIGVCLLRTDKNSAFHVEKFTFESDCEHLNVSISV